MRSTLDKLVSYLGLVAAIVLLVAGGLLTWASSFIGNQVDEQLSDQQITMPTAEAIDADEGLSDEDKAAMKEHADGGLMNTGPEARDYADHYILPHMNHSTGGETYSTLGKKVTEACGANRENADSEECIAANAQRDTAFKGSTLRGLLLYGYAFATVGSIAMYAAIGAFIGAIVMLLLVVLGLRHAKQAEGVTT